MNIDIYLRFTKQINFDIYRDLLNKSTLIFT